MSLLLREESISGRIPALLGQLKTPFQCKFSTLKRQGLGNTSLRYVIGQLRQKKTAMCQL